MERIPARQVLLVENNSNESALDGTKSNAYPSESFNRRSASSLARNRLQRYGIGSP